MAMPMRAHLMRPRQARWTGPEAGRRCHGDDRVPGRDGRGPGGALAGPGAWRARVGAPPPRRTPPRPRGGGPGAAATLRPGPPDPHRMPWGAAARTGDRRAIPAQAPRPPIGGRSARAHRRHVRCRTARAPHTRPWADSVRVRRRARRERLGGRTPTVSRGALLLPVPTGGLPGSRQRRLPRRPLLWGGAAGVLLAACGHAPASRSASAAGPTSLAPGQGWLYLTILTGRMLGRPGFPEFVPADFQVPAHALVHGEIRCFDGGAATIPAGYQRVRGTPDRGRQVPRRSRWAARGALHPPG